MAGWCDPLKKDVIHAHGKNQCQPPKYYDLKNHDILGKIPGKESR